jgi:hypothetical protein
MFAGPPDQSAAWSDSGAEGAFRFLRRLWNSGVKLAPKLAAAAPGFEGASPAAAALRREMHLLLRQVSADYDRLQYNTVVSGAMKLLTEFPDQKQVLIDNPGLMGGAVDEFIRMVSPVIYMRRTATADVELNGQLIREGEKVIMYYGAANRDPEVFPNPDQLDVRRPNAGKHIAFGYGPHTCIGKRVAQIQLEEAYRQILARFPDLVATGEMEIAPNNFVHAISKLMVRRG